MDGHPIQDGSPFGEYGPVSSNFAEERCIRYKPLPV
jgi:hypothetical protein